MAYRVEGLKRSAFEGLIGLPDEVLLRRGARRVTVDRKPGYPCRVTLDDAEPGERLILFHHVSNDVAGPYRAAHAVYVRESASEPACFVDEPAPVFASRTLSLRGFDTEGDMRAALLAAPGEADSRIREILAFPEVAEIHAHNAAPGCFAARIVRN